MTEGHTPLEASFSSELRVDYRDHMGDDAAIVEAMLVSTQGEDALDAEASAGRINFLMSNRHGTPFEQTAIKVYVKAPIAVFREWHRHRIGFSYNETSGRYRELHTEFYNPPPERPLVQTGKPGAYKMVPGTKDQYQAMLLSQQRAAVTATLEYDHMLHNLGIAKEVARGVLGVYLYTDMITTLNVRSAMAFLSLRQEHPPEEAMFPSHPMWEINRCADQLEQIVTDLFPLAMATYVANKRVCP